MSHLRPELLWDCAGGKPLPSAQAEHLSACAGCKAQLAQVQQAKGLLVHRGPPPPLDPVVARRIGAVLKEAAEQQLKPRAWPFDLNPLWALAGVAAAVLAVLVWNQAQLKPPEPAPIAQHPLPAPPRSQLAQAPGSVAPPPAVEAARPPRLAKVTSSRKAKNQNAELLKSQTLAEGSQVKTEAGGALWLQLPDGSRAGLTGASELQLDTLEDKHLGLTLRSGNVLVMARHLPDRVLTVKAGEVEVRDVGTRFLVSRDLSRVLVAVEEGVVEVNAPGNKLMLRAGRSAEWREGRLVEQPWAPSPVQRKAPAPLPAPAPPAEPSTPPIEPNTPLTTALAPVSEPDPGKVARLGNPEEEWAAPPNLPRTVAAPPAAAPAVEGTAIPAAGGEAPAGTAPVEVAPDAPAPAEEEASVLSLEGLEQRLKKVARVVKAPFAAIGSSMRETRSREVGRLADEGDCDEALKRAEAWLADRPSGSSDEPRWRRSVQVNQLRCYTRLHRDAEAAKVKALLE